MLSRRDTLKIISLTVGYAAIPNSVKAAVKLVLGGDIVVNNPPPAFSIFPNIANLRYPLDVNYTGNEDMLYTAISGNDPAILGVEATVEKLSNDHYTIHLRFDSYDELTTQNVTVTITDTLTGIHDKNPKPNGYELSENYPNPFNPSTNIDFKIPAAQRVKIEIYDINGELISTVLNKEMTAGKHTINISAAENNLNASQVYIYRMEAGSFVKTKTMVMMK